MLASHTSEFVVVDRPPANPKVFCVGGGSEYFGDSLCRSKGPPFKQAVHTENRATAQSCLTSPKTDASLKNTHVWLIGKKPPLSRSPFPPACVHTNTLFRIFTSKENSVRSSSYIDEGGEEGRDLFPSTKDQARKRIKGKDADGKGGKEGREGQASTHSLSSSHPFREGTREKRPQERKEGGKERHKYWGALNERRSKGRKFFLP